MLYEVITESSNSPARTPAAGVPRWVTPTTIAAGLGVVAALVVLNVAALVVGGDQSYNFV